MNPADLIGKPVITPTGRVGKVVDVAYFYNPGGKGYRLIVALNDGEQERLHPDKAKVEPSKVEKPPVAIPKAPAAKPAAPASVGGQVCPQHGVAAKSRFDPDGLYCPTKVNGGWCQWRLRPKKKRAA